MSHMLFLGLGYSARIIARRLTADGWTVSGTSRTEAGAQAIAAQGWHGIAFDGARRSPALTAALGAATHVLVSVPPEQAGDPVLTLHADDLAVARNLAWIGYFSTVGVYGDENGGWVDEATVATPKSERGMRRLTAEAHWQRTGRERGVPVFVFRLPGIYGPGRSAIDAVKAGTARRIIKPGQVFNRIHVEDIARAVLAAIRQPEKADVYNVTDDLPAPPEDVVTFAAQLLGVAPPPAVAFEAADLSPMARSFYGESKRVANARLKSVLGVTLAYPTYREGLAAIAGQSGSDRAN